MDELGMSNLGVADVRAVATVTIEEVVKSNFAEAKDSPLYLDVVKCDLSYEACLSRIRKSENTADKEASDKRRDDAYVGMRKVLGGFMCSPDDTIKAKAMRLYWVLDMYGSGIERKADSKESEYLKVIINKLNEPENKQLVLDLGITSYVTLLERCEKEFRLDWGSMEGDKEAFRNSESASHGRKKLEASLMLYFNFVSYSAKFAPSKRDEWAKLESAIYSRYTSIRQKYHTSKKKDVKKVDTKPTDSK